MKLITLIAALLFSFNVYAANWAEDFEDLKDVPRSYQDSGAICEEIARLDFQKKYPAPQYKIEVGIAYGDGQRTIGELDVVVFEGSEVILVGEVKCWKDLRDGLKKARSQRARFLKSLDSSTPLSFISTSTRQKFSPESFQTVQDFISIGQLGAVESGYDAELGYTLPELHSHTEDMISCQKSGECAHP